MATAPNAVNYSNQLPLGIEAKSQRRLFFPTTGDSYSGDGSSIIRISLNYDGMLDTSLSYLKFDFKNTTTDGGTNNGVAIRDLGQPEIARLVVSSGGVVLEDIQNYNQLVGSILTPCQANAGVIAGEVSNYNAFAGAIVGANTANDTKASEVVVPVNGAQRGACAYETGVKTGGRANAVAGSNSIGIAKDTTISVCYKLVSGLLDNEKYLPLVLMNNGLDIEIHLESGVRLGCCADDTPIVYEISNVRYVAHLIDLQRDFYDMLRMTQQQSGGVIQIAGQTYRHFSNSVPKTSQALNSYNIPVRARSIKSIFFVGAPAVAGNQRFDLSSTSRMALHEYQVQIGATKYPPTAIKTNGLTNMSESYNELMKSFGKLGSTIHDNLLTGVNYIAKDDITTFTQGTFMNFSPYGIDLETFRAEIENGVDTSSRALPMTLLLTYDGAGTSAGADLTLHTYALIDALFFVNMDGSVSVSA